MDASSVVCCVLDIFYFSSSYIKDLEFHFICTSHAYRSCSSAPMKHQHLTDLQQFIQFLPRPYTYSVSVHSVVSAETIPVSTIKTLQQSLSLSLKFQAPLKKVLNEENASLCCYHTFERPLLPCTRPCLYQLQ